MTDIKQSSARHHLRRIVVSILALCLLGSVLISGLNASEIETYAFEKVWWRTDLPVEMNQTDRTWVWGPEPISGLLLEPYDQGSASGMDGVRWVQYFDKTRVEITRSDGDRGSDWYVTNGLLARELITGRMQIGDANHVQYEPARINVAGDSNDPDAPTYHSLSQVFESSPHPAGSTVTQTLSRDGTVDEDPDLASYGVTTSDYVGATDRTIASVFWGFMNSEGTIYDGFDFVEGRLFEDPLFATGLPITEPYWITVNVSGEPQRVLVQAFQRRVLTYTPGNPEGWQVEAANVGRHYHQWRYTDNGAQALRTSDITTKRDLSGNLIFMGEVENNARATYGEVEIELTIQNDEGEPVESFRTFVDSSMIEPGERLPFQIWTEYTGDYSDYEVTVQSRPSPRFSRPEVSLETADGHWESTVRYEVDGTIRNTGDEPVEYLQFVVALYDAEGRVVDYRWGMVDPVVLEPGEETRFDTFFFEPGRFSEYRVFVSD